MGTETYSRTTSTSGTGGAGGTSGALGQEGERSENGQSIAHSSDGASPHMAHGGRVPPVGGALLCRDPSRGTERPQPRSGQCSGGEVGPGGRGWGSPRAEQHLRSHRDLHFCQQDRRGRGHRGHREHQGGRQGPSHHGHPERRRRISTAPPPQPTSPTAGTHLGTGSTVATGGTFGTGSTLWDSKTPKPPVRMRDADEGGHVAEPGTSSLHPTSRPASPGGPARPGGPMGPGGPRSPGEPEGPCLPGSPYGAESAEASDTGSAHQPGGAAR